MSGTPAFWIFDKVLYISKYQILAESMRFVNKINVYLQKKL